MPLVFDYFQPPSFTNGMDPGRLANEVVASSTIGSLYLSSELSGPGINPVHWKVTFSTNLTSGQEDDLDAIVAAHDPTVPLPHGFTVAQLTDMQPGVSAGLAVFARNALKVGETTGNGTGTLVYSTGTAWLRTRDDLSPTT